MIMLKTGVLWRNRGVETVEQSHERPLSSSVGRAADLPDRRCDTNSSSRPRQSTTDPRGMLIPTEFPYEGRDRPYGLDRQYTVTSETIVPGAIIHLVREEPRTEGEEIVGERFSIGE